MEPSNTIIQKSGTFQKDGQFADDNSTITGGTFQKSVEATSALFMVPSMAAHSTLWSS